MESQETHDGLPNSRPYDVAWAVRGQRRLKQCRSVKGVCPTHQEMWLIGSNSRAAFHVHNLRHQVGGHEGGSAAPSKHKKTLINGKSALRLAI